MNYTATAKANDERRWADERMHSYAESREQRQRYSATTSLEAERVALQAICHPVRVNTPVLTLEAATARLSEIADLESQYLFGDDVPNPRIYAEEKARLEHFIANNP